MQTIEKCAVILLLAVFILPGSAGAQQARARVNRTNATLEDVIMLTVSVAGVEDSVVDVSKITDFSVVSRGTSTSVQIVNNSVTREATHSYTLIPKKEGRFVIPPLDVTARGKVLRTRPITIQISKTPQTGQKARQIFVSSSVSNPNPYVGEQIIYSFDLYYNTNINISDFTVPEFSGFTSAEIDGQVPYSQRKSYQKTVEGQTYNVTELFKFILTPLNEGIKTIDPMILNCGIVKQRRRQSAFDSFFNDPFSRRVTVPKVLRSEPVNVNVRPLPPFDGEGEFSGLVGKFNFQAEIGSQALKVGDSATLSVSVSGTGNIMDMEEPKISVPKEFKIYRDAPEEETHLGKTGYSGKKVFRSAVVPVKQGDYNLDPIWFSYFDAAGGKYVTRKAGPFALKVGPGEKKDELEVFSGSEELGALKKKVEFTGRDILPIKEDLAGLETRKPLSLAIFLLLLAIPPAVFAAVKTALAITGKNESPAAVMAERAEKAIRDAGAATDADQFLSRLYVALVSAILSKAGMKGESLTYKEAANILRTGGYPEETANAAAKLLEKIESAKFGGIDLDGPGRDSLLSETSRMVRELR